jgi:hypothetical protein
MSRPVDTERHAPRGLGVIAPIFPAPWLIRVSGFPVPTGSDPETDGARRSNRAKPDSDPPSGVRASGNPIVSRTARPA